MPEGHLHQRRLDVPPLRHRCDHAVYVRYRLFELALSADVVAAGTISSVGRKTFELSVEEVIVGDREAPGATLPGCRGNKPTL